MGYDVHRAMVITTYGRIGPGLDALLEAAEAVGIRDLISAPVMGRVNGWVTVVLASHGSKAGWADAEQAENQAEALIGWLNAPEQAGWYHWAQVQYGDDEGRQGVLDASNWVENTAGPEAAPAVVIGELAAQAIEHGCPPRAVEVAAADLAMARSDLAMARKRKEAAERATACADHTDDDGPVIHSFVGNLGADWSLESVLEAIQTARTIAWERFAFDHHHLALELEPGRWVSLQVEPEQWPDV